ncbi:MAG: comF [Verrucomicrobiales bacterium]|nr:comF [Verrucomicrobiales bacterium]
MKLTAQTVWKFVDSGLNLFYPAVCQFCREQRAGYAESYICGVCRRKVHVIDGGYCSKCGIPYDGAITNEFECGECKDADLKFDAARAAVRVNAFMLDVVHRYKYARALWLEKFLGDLLVQAALPELAKESWDFIVPVPLHSVKQREREFNQAERIAMYLGRAVNIPVNTSILKRVEPTESQTRLSREERAENVRKAFALRDAVDLKGKNMVLIDDILTTGATTSACAGILKKAGASKVQVWTVARGA